MEMDKNAQEEPNIQTQTQNETLKPKDINQSGVVVITTAVVTVLIVLGVVGYLLYSKQSKPQQQYSQ